MIWAVQSATASVLCAGSTKDAGSAAKPLGCRAAVAYRPMPCEHAFVTSQGHPYSQFRRALLTKNATLVVSAAHELSEVSLTDALKILTVLAEKHDRRFDRGAVRFLGRLCMERRLGLADVRWALAHIERLPVDPEGVQLTLARLLGDR